MNSHYLMTKTKMANEDGVNYTAYGIKAVNKNTGGLIEEIVDISDECNFVEKLVKMFNENDLHIEHFKDVVYDFVVDKYT